MNENKDVPSGDMGTVEWLCYCILLACLFYFIDSHFFPRQEVVKQLPIARMTCPDIRMRHYVGSDLKTGINAVDACSKHLNPWSK